MKRITLSMLMLVGALVLSVSCSDDDDKGSGQKDIADLVVYGKIFTSDNDKVVKAFAVKDGKFVYVGDREGVAKYAGADTKVVNYTGKGLVIPGCTEGHGHFIGIDGVARNLPGFRTPYKDLVKTIIPQKMQKNPGSFLSFGWPTQDVKKYSTNDYAMEIEAVSEGYPVILLDGGGHNALCNRTALRKAGLIDDSGHKIKDVRGGEIIAIQGSDNIASGYLTDEAVPFVIENSLGTILDDAGYIQACKDAVMELNARGFTSYLDAYINIFDDGDIYKYLAQMDDEGALTINVMGYYTIRSYDWGLPKSGAIPQRVKDKLDRIIDLSNQYTKGHVQANGVKLLDAGIVVSSSTDAPCGETIPGTVPNIIGVTATGLFPTYLDAAPLGSDDLLTVSEALKCLTINGAASLGLEEERGSIEVGKYADFVVLDKDVLELEAQDKRKEIFQVNVTSTWFEGKQVYPKIK